MENGEGELVLYDPFTQIVKNVDQVDHGVKELLQALAYTPA